MEDQNKMHETGETLSDKIDDINRSVNSLKETLEIRGKEIDLLQVESNKPKKWWNNPSSIISLIALLMSAFVTINSLDQQEQKKISEKQLRVKEIVQRISDIQTQYANAGAQLGAIQQITFSEVTNLVDEAIGISEENINFLNDSEYNTIIAMAFLTNKTEKIETLIENALKTVNDVSTEYGIRNYQANYYFLIKHQPEKGREIIKEVIHKSEEQQISNDGKKANIANEYLLWSNLEFQIGNYKQTDSILKIAEKLVVTGEDSWRFVNYPVTQNIKASREYLNNSGNIALN